MGGIKGEQSWRRRRNVIKCGVLKLWERDKNVLND
jgi:hypothetical protein